MREVEALHVEGSGTGIMSLAIGMVEDTHQLAQQEFALMKSEFLQELQKVKTASGSMAFALVIFFVGLVPLPFLFAELLLYLTPENFPVWLAQLSASIFFLLLGVTVFLIAKNRLSS